MLLIIACVHAHAAQFAEIADKKAVDLAEIVANVAGVDVLFIGEIHDRAQHHQIQLDIVRSLHAKKLTIAIGLEMFTTGDQQQLDDWIVGKLDEESFKTIYSMNWSYEWQLYRDLFIFARDNHIPLIALNVPKEVISRAKAQGSSALQESEIPPKMSWSLNESQAHYMRAITRQVFGGTPPDKLVARLCEAQALRNNWMAWNVAKYMNKREGDRVVVIAGTWHAVKSGVPERLSAYEKFTYKVILPELPEFRLENATVKEADYLITR
jgi:uncharacterized iron-regulated protein